MNKLPDHLPRRYIIEAIHLWDAGETHQFQPARLYEIEYHGRRYPSKAIAGIAATLMTGTQFTPADFTGGIKSKCVKLLIEQGFHIHLDKAAAAPIADVLFPDELPSQETYLEGAAIKVTVNRYERDKKARDKAVEHHGCQCNVCGVDLVRFMVISLKALSMCITWCRCQPLKRITSWIQLMICCLCTLIAMRCCTDANHRLRRSS